MGHFKAHSKTLGPYQDRPFTPSRPQDRSSKNPKTLDRLLGRGSEEGGLRRKAKPGIEPHFLAVGLPSERVDEPGRRVSKNCAGGICMWVGANYCSHHERFGMCLFNIRLQKYIMR